MLSNAEENYLAAGLKLPIVLKYDPQDAGCHVGEIVLYVDDQRSAVVPIEAKILAQWIQNGIGSCPDPPSACLS